MKKPVRILLTALFWLALWQIVSAAVGEEILFPSPLSAGTALAELCRTAEFWITVGATFRRILLGILASSALGILAGLGAGLFAPLGDLLSPAMTVIRTAPVASFIVLLVLWMKRGSVPGVIAALMVLPVFYSNVREGIHRVDPDLLEMAGCFKMGFRQKLQMLYLPSLKPFLFSAAGSSFGMAWKAGVAAEVIVLPVSSIGRRLYYASSNLETRQVFAWTAAVILLSLLMDRLVSFVFREQKQKPEKNRIRKEVRERDRL